MMFSMLQYIAPQDFVLSVVKNKPHSLIIVGSMGSGKTTWTLSLIARATEELLGGGKDDNEIAVVHSLEMSMNRIVSEVSSSLDLPRIRYLYWFSDDAAAAEGQHARRAMSRENVEESRFYTVVRHRLEKLGFSGFIFVAHATQVYNLLDVTFRRLAKIKVFKDYPDEPSDLKIIGPMLGKAYLKKLAEITYKIWAPRSREDLVDGLESAVTRFIRRKKVVRVRKKDLPRSINYLRIEPEELESSTLRDTAIQYNVDDFEYIVERLRALREKGILQSRGRYIYIKTNGTTIPFIKRDIAIRLGLIQP